jgi:transcriptional/translational regulatory protein YebC/TACO1
VRTALEQKGFKSALAEVTFKPTAETVLKGDEAARIQKLIDALEGIDDVQEVYTTAVIESS